MDSYDDMPPLTSTVVAGPLSTEPRTSEDAPQPAQCSGRSTVVIEIEGIATALFF